MKLVILQLVFKSKFKFRLPASTPNPCGECNPAQDAPFRKKRVSEVILKASFYN
jgi:hypothetical protein